MKKHRSMPKMRWFRFLLNPTKRKSSPQGMSDAVASLLIIVLIDVKVSELVRSLAWRDDSKEVPELLHLQVFLCEVLQIPFRKWRLGAHIDLSLIPGDGNLVSEVASLALHLDPVQVEFLQVLGSHDDNILEPKDLDVVVMGLLAINGELQYLLL